MLRPKVRTSRIISILMILLALCLATLLTVSAEGDAKAQLVGELDRFEAAVADKELYTSTSYAAWQSAYDNGIITNNTLGATEDALLSALSALKEAYEGLELRGDNTALTARLSEIALIDLSVYTPDTVKNFEASKTAALAVNENIDATESDINTALLNLESSVVKLQRVADFTALNSALADVNAINLNLYSAEGASAMKMAIEIAETVANDKNAPQSVIDAVTAKLAEAKSKLVLHGNTDKLRAAVEEIKALPSIYTKQTFEPLLVECALAILMLNESHSPSEIDAKIATLTALKEKLVVREDKKELYTLITEAGSIDASEYEEYKLEEFREVIASATAVLNELNPDKDKVEETISSLTAAREKLDEKDLTKARAWWVWLILAALLIAGFVIDLIFDGWSNLSLRFIAVLFLLIATYWSPFEDLTWWMIVAALLLIIALFRISAKRHSKFTTFIAVILSASLIISSVFTDTFWWCIYAVPIASLILLFKNRKRDFRLQTVLYTLLSLVGFALILLTVLCMIAPETFWWFIWWYY